MYPTIFISSQQRNEVIFVNSTVYLHTILFYFLNENKKTKNKYSFPSDNIKWSNYSFTSTFLSFLFHFLSPLYETKGMEKDFKMRKTICTHSCILDIPYRPQLSYCISLSYICLWSVHLSIAIFRCVEFQCC